MIELELRTWQLQLMNNLLLSYRYPKDYKYDLKLLRNYPINSLYILFATAQISYQHSYTSPSPQPLLGVYMLVVIPLPLLLVWMTSFDLTSHDLPLLQLHELLEELEVGNVLGYMVTFNIASKKWVDWDR